MHISNIDWGGGGATTGSESIARFFGRKKYDFGTHFFCAEPVAYLRNPNFFRATRFLVDLPAQGGAVRFFISGFVATALAISNAKFCGREIFFENFGPKWSAVATKPEIKNPTDPP